MPDALPTAYHRTLIAARTGLSTRTVDRYFTDPEGRGPSVRARIESAITSLGLARVLGREEAFLPPRSPMERE